MDYLKSPLYKHIGAKEINTEYLENLKMDMISSILKDEDFRFIMEDEEFKELLENIK